MAGKHIPILDSIRGFAAFWVFLSHSFSAELALFFGGKIPIFQDGRAGVDIFMILSGYLMVHLHLQMRSRAEVFRFWLARFFRISPVYYLLLLLSLFLIAQPVADQLLGLFYSATYLFGFMQNPPPSIMPDWSIGLEMQFYLVFPLLAYTLRKQHFILVALIAMGGSLLFHSLFSVYELNPGFILGNYSQPTLLPFKFPMFLLGCFLAHPDFFHNKIRSVFALGIAFLGVLYPALILTGYKSSIVIYGAVLLLYFLWNKGGLRHEKGVLFFTCNRITKFFGDVSYGVYLMHLLFLQIVRSFFGFWEVESLFQCGAKWSVVFLISGILTYFVAWIILVAYEAPLIRVGKQVAERLFPRRVV